MPLAPPPPPPPPPPPQPSSPSPPPIHLEAGTFIELEEEMRGIEIDRAILEMHPPSSPPSRCTCTHFHPLPSPPLLSLCGEIQAGFMAPKLKLCRVFACLLGPRSLVRPRPSVAVLPSSCFSCAIRFCGGREREQMGFSRADEERRRGR